MNSRKESQDDLRAAGTRVSQRMISKKVGFVFLEFGAFKETLKIQDKMTIQTESFTKTAQRN